MPISFEPAVLDVQRNGGSDGGPFAPNKQFTTDVLLTYLPHPGTAVYLGYNNGYSDLNLRPGAPVPIVVQGAPNNSTSSLFFLNVSYVLRY